MGYQNEQHEAIAGAILGIIGIGLFFVFGLAPFVIILLPHQSPG